jgi:hypothetical protein
MLKQNDDSKFKQNESLTEEDGLISTIPKSSSVNVDIENRPLKYSSSNSVKKMTHSNNLNNLIMSCVKNEEYCLTMLDYMKKMCHFSQIDYFSAYTQLLYCFKPREM